MNNFEDISIALGQENHKQAISFFEDLLKKLEIHPPENVKVQDLDVLVSSVNIERLSNNPKKFCTETIRNLYKEILEV